MEDGSMNRKWVDSARPSLAYHSQFLQDMFINASLFEIDARAINHIGDDLRVYVPNLCIRHLAGGFTRVAVGVVCLVLKVRKVGRSCA